MEDPEISYSRNNYKAILQSFRMLMEENLDGKQIDEKKVKDFVEKMYNRDEIIKENYEISDLMEWFYGDEYYKN